jgi:hypothetical protein
MYAAVPLTPTAGIVAATDAVTLIVRSDTTVKLHSDVFDTVMVIWFLVVKVLVPGKKFPFAYKPDVTFDVFNVLYVNP